MKRTVFFSCIIFCIVNLSSAIAQKTLSLDDMFSAGFKEQGYSNVQWLPVSQGYTKTIQTEAGMALSRYDLARHSWHTLIAPEELKPADTHEPLKIESYAWSADESKLLIYTNSRKVWRKKTRGDYWVFDMTKRTLHQLGASLPASSLMFAKFSPDNNRAAYVSQSNLYVEDLNTGKISQLTHDGTRQIINGTFDWAYEEEFKARDGFRWSDDGDYIAFWQIDATGIRNFLMINNTDSIYSYTIPVQYPVAGQNPSSAKIGVVDLGSGNIRWMDIPGDSRQHYLPRMQWIPDSHHLLIQQLNRKQNHLKIYNTDATTGEGSVVYEEQDAAWIELISSDLVKTKEMLDLTMTQEGKSFVMLTEKDGWRHLYEIDIDGKQERLLTPGAFDVAAFYGLDKQKGYLYFNASPDNATQRYLYRKSIQTSKNMERLTPEEYAGINNYNISPDFKFAIHTYTNANTPNTISLIKLPGHRKDIVLVSNESLKKNLTKYNVPKVEFFKVTTADGITMDGRMIKPEKFDSSKKYPVVFYVYGEPWSQTATDDWVGIWNLFLAQQGYIVITMDNRGTPTLKGRAWRKSIYRKIGVLNAHDQAAATREVLKWNFIDANKVAVWGWSGGGSTTLSLMFNYPDIYKVGMSVAPVTNLLYYDNIYEERYMGLPQENHKDYFDGSPINFTKNLKGKLLLVHGTGDDNVHYQNSEALINELIANNKQFDLMIYPNRSHSINEGAGTRKHLYHLLYRFLSRQMPPKLLH